MRDLRFPWLVRLKGVEIPNGPGAGSVVFLPSIQQDAERPFWHFADGNMSWRLRKPRKARKARK